MQEEFSKLVQLHDSTKENISKSKLLLEQENDVFHKLLKELEVVKYEEKSYLLEQLVALSKKLVGFSNVEKDMLEKEHCHRSQISDLEQEIKLKTNDLKFEKSNNHLLLLNQKTFEKKFTDLKDELKNKTNLITKLNHEIDKLSESNFNRLNELHELENNLNESNSNIVNLKQNLTFKESEIIELKSKINDIQEKNLQFKHQIDQSNVMNSRLLPDNAINFNLSKDMSEIKNKLSQFELLNKNLEQKNIDLEQQIQSLNLIFQSNEENLDQMESDDNTDVETDNHDNDIIIKENDRTIIKNSKLASSLVIKDKLIGKYKSSGKANGRPVFKGPRGGVYYLNRFYNKVSIDKIKRQCAIEPF